MHILSIQSSVARGFVGNRTAVFALQRLGHEVICIDTVAYSNHPAHGGFRGAVHPAESLDRIVTGLEERGFLEDIDLVLSGYLGSAGNAAAVARAVDRVGVPYLLDPVMGDDPKGLFVAPDLPDAIRRDLLPRAAATTPNRFELSLLAGREVDGPADAAAAAAGLGPPLVVATSVPAGEGRIACIGVSEEGEVQQVTTPRVAHPSYGAGDLFAALFAARWRDGWADAMALAAGTRRGG
ncbi:MAG: pyridoxal kinase, partial [Alphaproteobacteria bacterium]|nr:pyridoxal kinase [Alphaproteobacteria bacterium]